jgi:peptide/nickel transport system permease protein
MNSWQFALKKLLGGVPLIIGVTLISFVLMVYFGPDLTYQLLGKNPSPEDITAMQHFLGYDQPFWLRYWHYLQELFTLNFGVSMVNDQPVINMLRESIPVTLMLMTPGFVLGNALALVLAMTASQYRGQWQDKAIMAFSVIGMSISFLIIIITFQIFFSSSYGLDLFPVRGWSTSDYHGGFNLINYLSYVTVPTLAIIFVSLGYNTRFYRAVLVEEFNKSHIITVTAYGHKPKHIMYKYLLKNAMIPIITRLVFSIPLIVVSGSLIIESYFGIPGIGLITYDSIVAGDQPVLKAVIGLTVVLFVLALMMTEILYRVFDPRIAIDQSS